MKNKVEEIMIKNPVCVEVDTNLQMVNQLIQNNGYSHIPVVKGGSLVGIVSKTDLMAKYMKIIGETSGRMYSQMLLEHFTVEDIMTADPIVVKKEDDIDFAAEILLQGVFHGLIVVNDAKEVEGVVTCFDLLKAAYSGFAQEQFADKVSQK